MSRQCPKCASPDVRVGHVVLGCNACGWRRLNEYPCDVCGGPSVSAMSVSGSYQHRCPEHPFTDKHIRDAFRGFLANCEAVTMTARPTPVPSPGQE